MRTTGMVNKSKVFLLIAILAVMLIGLTLSLHSIFEKNQISIDFFSYWNAGRMFFIERGDPYGTQVSLINQLSIYRMPAQGNLDHLFFAYPLFILIPLFPFFYIPYDWALAIWMSINIITILSFPFIFHSVPNWLKLTYLLIYPVYFTVIIGNIAALISLYLLIVVFYVIFLKEAPPWLYFIFGLGLSFCLGKPQLIWLYLLLILVVSLINQKKLLVAGFLGGSLLFTSIFLILYPNWILNWYRNASHYSSEGGLLPRAIELLSLAVPQGIVWIFYAGLFVAALIFTIVLFFLWKNGKIDPILLLAWCSWVTNFFDPSSYSPDQNILLIPMFFWCLSNRKKVASKITWLLAILVSNAGFLLTLFKVLPKATVENSFFWFFSLWLAVLLLDLRRKPDRHASGHEPISLAF